MMKMRDFGLLFSILLTTQNIVIAKSNSKHDWLSMEKWTKSLIEDTGCPFVSQDQMLVRNVCLMPYYQPNESPQQSILSVSPHYVDVNLLKADILMVDEDNNKLTIHISQNLHWFDHRIKANFSYAGQLIKLVPSNVVKIWHPDLELYTINLLKWESLYYPSLYKDIMITNYCSKDECENEDELFVELIAWKEWTATIACEFEFEDFPFDTQTCQFVQIVYGDSSTHIKYLSNLTYDVHTAVGFEIEISLHEYGQNEINDNSMLTKRIGFNITLKRIFGSYLYQSYFPCAAIVGVSQISFLIPPDSIPGRISLIATQFLTLTNIFIYQLSHSPFGTQLNALEVYILTSLFFVLATIVEFGLVLLLKRIHILGAQNIEEVALEPRFANSRQDKGYSIADKIDFASFMLFPFAYIVFNCIYVMKYSDLSNLQSFLF